MTRNESTAVGARITKRATAACITVVLTRLTCIGQPYTQDAVSREISVFNDGVSSARIEAISREISVFNDGVSGAALEAISREISVFNDGLITPDVSSREVSIFNYGNNQLDLTVGSTALRAGDAGQVPITLSSLAPITDVQMVVDFPANLLTNWTIQPAFTGGAYVTNGSQLYLEFAPSERHSLFQTQELGQVTFTAVSEQPSGFLPLLIAGATGIQADGNDTPTKRLYDGEVVVIHTNPLLRNFLGSSNQEYLTLYGLPGTNYTLESAINLNQPIVWTPVLSLTPPGFILSTSNLPNTNAAIFYRARQ